MGGVLPEVEAKREDTQLPKVLGRELRSPYRD
jgi:hypothetical protein